MIRGRLVADGPYFVTPVQYYSPMKWPNSPTFFPSLRQVAAGGAVYLVPPQSEAVLILVLRRCAASKGTSWYRMMEKIQLLKWDGWKPFQFTSHKICINTSKSISHRLSYSVVFSFLGWGCHSEIATFAYYPTMDGRWFLAIIFLFMGSLESQRLPHSKIQMTGSWDEKYCVNDYVM